MKKLIIPSAVLIPKDMRKRFGEIPTSLFPLDNIPMIEHIYKYYSPLMDEIVLVVNKKADLIEDYVKRKKMNINIICLDEIKDLGYTIYQGLANSTERTDKVYIHFADTMLLHNDDMPHDDCCCIDEECFNSTWTFFKEEEGEIIDVFDKVETLEMDTLSHFPFFIGAFSINNPLFFEKCLSCQLERKNDKDCDSFYAALMQYSHRYPFEFKKVTEWFDVGHSEKYIQAKTGVKARNFNTISIDEKRGILRKTSKNVNKFIHEIEWYIKLPSKIQYLIPRIYSYSIDRENPYVEMECYGYNTLHELLLFGEIPLYRWQDIFEKVRFAINDMEQYKVSYSNDCDSAIREIYFSKTISRLNQLKSNELFERFFNEKIHINGKEYLSLNEYMNCIPGLVEKYLLNKKQNFTIIHGDLCFSNILLEENHGFVRVIDPRGEFGNYDIYGDPRYEMAKLLHSIEGKYDFIIEDLFDISVEKTNIIYKMQKRTDRLLKVFYDVFRNEIEDINAVRFIESLLFLSMIPLHSDYPKRQYAMLSTGVILLNSLLV